MHKIVFIDFVIKKAACQSLPWYTVRLIRSNFLDIVVTFTTAFWVTGRYPQRSSPASALFLGWSEKSALSDGTFRPLVSRDGGLVLGGHV